MNNDVLLAIRIFTLMGLILERSGMAEDLLDTIGQLFGTVRGGLAYAVVFVGALLAATTGVVAASVISMGLISLPIMLRYGYDRRVASRVIAASGTLAQIIPPSPCLDRDGRPARKIGWRHVRRRLSSPALFWRPSMRCTSLWSPDFRGMRHLGLPPDAVWFSRAGREARTGVTCRTHHRLRDGRVSGDAQSTLSRRRFCRSDHGDVDRICVFCGRAELGYPGKIAGFRFLRCSRSR